MKVLSFDVGIKNLAGCIIEYNDLEPDIKSKLNIHYWDIINLVESKKEEDYNPILFKCYEEKCNAKPKSYIDFDNNKYCFCTKHLTKKDIYLKNVFNNWDKSLWEQKKDCICSKCENDVTNTRKTYYYNPNLNITLCSKHYKILTDKVVSAQNKLYPIKSKKVKDITSNDLRTQLVKCLDQRLNSLLRIADIVLIENQPTFKNPTMKAISDTLYTWFIIRGIIDKDLNKSTIKEIKFISPSNKLKEFDTKKLDDANDNKKYAVTKKLSIENTKTILASYNLNDWINRLQSFDKKDDLCDSFLQGWYVLNNNYYKDQLYNEWQELYNQNVINVEIEVKELIEKKIKLRKPKKVEITDINLTKFNIIDIKT